MFTAKSLAQEWNIPTKKINIAIFELQLKLLNDEKISPEQAEMIKTHLGLLQPVPQLQPQQAKECKEQRGNSHTTQNNIPQNSLTIPEATEIYGEALVKDLVSNQTLVSPDDIAVLDAIVAEQQTQTASLQQGQNNISSEQELLRLQLQQAAITGVQKAQLLHLAEKFPMAQTMQALIEQDVKATQEQNTNMQKFIGEMYSTIPSLSGVDINLTVQELDDTSKKIQNRIAFIQKHQVK